MSELKPCPFCGSTCLEIYGNKCQGKGRYWVACVICGAQLYTTQTREAAVAAWNKRVTAAQKPKRRKA